MPTISHHTTRAHPAYDPPHSDVSRPWLILVSSLFLTALVSLSMRPVCRPDLPGANESAFGIRHQQRGKVWYHCEPWIRHVLSK